MDPQTKQSIFAHTPDELREQLRKWLDSEKVFQAWHANAMPATVMIEISYADEQGVLSKTQFIHTRADVLRKFAERVAQIQQQELFK